MRYLGGKKLIANDIADIVSPHIVDTYHEPFCGGLWVSVAIAKRCKPSTTLFLSDVHTDLIMLYQALHNDDIELPEYVTEDEYREFRHKKPSALRGFVGFGSSFGGKWFAGYARGENRNFTKETKNRLTKHFSLLRQFNVQFSCKSFSDIAPSNSTVYCDPPYKDTTSYTKVDRFNHEQYYSKLNELTKDNTVFCSEYSMPLGVVVYEKKKTVSVNKDDRSFKATERLYKL